MKRNCFLLLFLTLLATENCTMQPSRLDFLDDFINQQENDKKTLEKLSIIANGLYAQAKAMDLLKKFVKNYTQLLEYKENLCAQKDSFIDDNGNIFCNSPCLQAQESRDIYQKYYIIFSILGGGVQVNPQLVQKLKEFVYHEETQEEILKLAISPNKELAFISDFLFMLIDLYKKDSDFYEKRSLFSDYIMQFKSSGLKVGSLYYFHQLEDPLYPHEINQAVKFLRKSIECIDICNRYYVRNNQKLPLCRERYFCSCLSIISDQYTQNQKKCEDLYKIIREKINVVGQGNNGLYDKVINSRCRGVRFQPIGLSIDNFISARVVSYNVENFYINEQLPESLLRLENND